MTVTTRIEIVNRGRGPQLSTNRITVQDLVPCLQNSWTYEQIMAAMPVLTVEEIQTVERYVEDNLDEVMEQDRRIRARNAARVIPAEIQAIRRQGHEKLLALKEKLAKKSEQERNGDQPTR
jgi:uncharacterized protein (DUF433 family)